MNHLNSDLLRTFLAVADAGSVTGGATRIHRSQSAASVQIGQLEALIGKPVFERHGRGVALSSAGEALAPAARQIVELLDSTLADMKGGGLEGSIRVGIPDDHSREALSEIVAAFAREHPKVELIVHCALSAGFPEALANGALDLAVHEVETLDPGMELLQEDRMSWVAARAHGAWTRDPLPVALFDRACWWRDAAKKSLEASGRAYRVVYSSESVRGVTAAIEAGIAVGVLSASTLSEGLIALPDTAGFAEMPSSKLVLEIGRDRAHKITRAMAEAIKRAYAAAPR